MDIPYDHGNKLLTQEVLIRTTFIPTVNVNLWVFHMSAEIKVNNS